MKQIEANLEISPEQAQLIEALFSSKNRKAAAVACGISTPTMYRWMANPAFQQALADAERQTVKDAVTRLTAEMGRSIDTLIELRQDGVRADAVRLKSAVALIQLGREMRESMLIEERLEALEDLVVQLAERI